MLISQAIWTIGGYGFSMVTRLGANIILSRLLVPQILGIMVVVSSVRIGLDLLTDVGIEQNIVQNEHGLEPAFFNTAWTIQIIRGALITAICLCLSSFLSNFYRIDLWIFLAISFAPFLSSCTSTSVVVLVKNLQVRTRNLFEMTVDFSTLVINVGLVWLNPTVASLVAGLLLSITLRAVISYTLPHPKHRLTLNGVHVAEILRFGKWIMLASLLLYVSSNLDRIYLARVVPLATLGIYGLARTISDLPTLLANRLAYQIVFPLMAGAQATSRRAVWHQLAPTRLKFVLLAGVGVGTLAGWSDTAIRILYDHRYDQAGWMLFILLMGAWLAILSGLNEAVILGLGRPVYSSVGNTAKFVALVVGLPSGMALFGFPGAIMAIAASEIGKFATFAIGQRRRDFSFIKQDVIATTMMIVTVIGWLWIRSAFNLGAGPFALMAR